jgi:hypothetical protein
LINKNNNTSKTKDHHHQDKVVDPLLLKLNKVNNKIRVVINQQLQLQTKLNLNSNNNSKIIKIKLEIKRSSRDLVEKKNINLASHLTKTHKKSNKWRLELLKECQA